MIRAWYCLIPVALVLTFLYRVADYDVSTGSGLPLYSSRRYDPFGSAALRELLAASGRTTRPLARPVPPPARDATLIMITPIGADSLDPRRWERLEDWVGGGNRLLVLSRDPPLLFRQAVTARAPAVADGFPDLSDRPAPMALYEDNQKRGRYADVLAVDTTPVALDIAGQDQPLTLELTLPSGFVPGADDDGLRVAAWSEGRAVVALRRSGAGELVWIADPTPALNQGIGSGDNARAILALAGAGDVFFDEYGLGRAETIMDVLRRAGLLPFLLQAVFVLWLLARSARTAFPSTVPDAAAAAGIERQLDILAGLYEKNLTDDEIETRRRRYHHDP
ncbi:MAG: DUF4350 domain-containing protein [Planctomycetes bacterium]|nr:DUF4350 domain-containing protein [Planctomycetota bacterium]